MTFSPLPGARADIAPFYAMEMAREAGRLVAAGKNIIRFDVGQPYEGASTATARAISAAVTSHPLGYTESLGDICLREALSRWYQTRYCVDVSPARIAITAGASGAFVLAFLAMFATGDRVAMASPGYPPYRHILTALGMQAATAEGRRDSDMHLTPDDVVALARDGPLAGALIASPANPTGAMLDTPALAALAQACRVQGIALISDEIYHGLSYDRAAETVLNVDPNAIVVNSFSKYWALTGWRIGWLVAPEALMGAIERLSQNLFICAPAPAQAAALAALDDPAPCEARRAVFAQNRQAILAAAPALNLPLAAPADGAFYAWLDISAHSDDAMAFCQRALHEAGVALTPGEDFDAARGHRFVRLSYPRQHAEVLLGLERLSAWLAK